MTNETEAVLAVERYDLNIPGSLTPEYGMVRDADGEYMRYTDHAALIDRLTGEVSRLRDELRRIAELDPSEDSSEGFNEWGEAECFRIAQGHAKQALTQPEADHG